MGVTVAGGALMGLALALKATALAVSPILGALTLLKISSTGVGAAFKLVAGVATNAFGNIRGAIGLLFNPLGLLVAAIVGIGVYALYMSGTFGRAVAAMKTLWNDFTVDVKTAWQTVMLAISKGRLDIAFKAATLLMRVAWLETVDKLQSVWGEFSLFFYNLWDAATTNAAISMTRLWSGIQTGWAACVELFHVGFDLFNNLAEKAFHGTVNKLSDWIIPIFAKLQGVDVDEARKTLQEDQERAQKARDNSPEVKARNERIKKADDVFKGKVGRIDADAAAAEQTLLDDNRQREDDRAATAGAGQKDRRHELDAARGQAHALLEEADRLRTGGTSKMSSSPRMGGDIDFSALRTSVIGTFSAHAAQGMGGGGPLDRIAQNTADTAMFVKKLVDKKGPKFT